LRTTPSPRSAGHWLVFPARKASSASCPRPLSLYPRSQR